MKIAPFIAIASVFASAQSFATTLTAYSLGAADGGATDTIITNQAGVPVQSGFVETGVFTITSSEVTALVAQGNFQALFAAFNPIGGKDDFQTGTGNIIGFPVAGSYVTQAQFDPTNYVGQTLYTIMSTGTAANPTGAAIQYGLLQYGTTLAADPAPPGLENTPSVTAANATILFGVKGTVSGSVDLGTTGSVSSIALQPVVPEASTALLGLLGVVGLVRRRR